MVGTKPENETECHINWPKKPGTTGFVFICPGRFEERDNRPCAGQTGEVLNDALAFLTVLRPDIFKFKNRYQYLITNAWTKIEFKAKTQRSVPECFEVVSRENIERLYAEICELTHVVACGKTAHLAVQLCVEYLNFEGNIAYVQHTSKQSLGCPTTDEYEGTLENWAKNVVQQF